MSGVNAQIPLSFRPAPVGPNFGAAIADASNLMQLQQAGQEEHRQNQLRGILGAPGALDDMGQPKPETMTKVMGVDPNAGMKLQSNFLATQQKKLQMDALKSKTSYEQADMLNNAYSPILVQYKENAAKMSPAQALKIAQDATTETTERLRTGGGMTPEAVQRLPTQFDPNKFEQMALQTDMYLKTRQQDRQDKKDEETGWQVVTDPGRLDAAGNPTQFRYNPRTGKSTTLDMKPYQPVNIAKQESVTPAAKAEHDAEVIAAANIAAKEKELGRQLRPEERAQITQQARLDPKVAAVEQTTAAREKAKQEAGEKMGVPETPEQRQATAAQLATGQPMTQVIPGWGKEAGKAREQARQDAIQLIRDQTGMTAAEAGVELANRGIEYASGKKSSGQLTTMLGATRQGVMQLDFNIDKTKQEMKKLGSTDLSPILNAIARGEERWTGNPAYTSLFYYMNATAMESARILSGGQASIQQLHEGARKEAERWMNINMTPASFDAVAKAIKEEGHYRLKSFEESLKEQRIGGKKPAGTDDKVPAPVEWRGMGGPWKDEPIPLDAIKKLKANPSSAAGFDEHFQSPGLAGIILGSGAAAPAAETKSPPAEAKPPAAAKPTESKAPTKVDGVWSVSPHLGDTAHGRWPAEMMATPEGRAAAARAAEADKQSAASAAEKYGPKRQGRSSDKAATNPNDLPDGSIVSQGGTRYRKQGGNWVAIE